MPAAVRLATLACLATVLGAPLAARAAAPAVDAAAVPVSGTWVKHEQRFTYMGFTSRYSCDGLEDQLKRLLLQAGARRDVEVTGSCTEPAGRPTPMAAARLTFYTLVPGEPPAAPPPPAPVAEHRLGKEAPKPPAPPPQAGVGAWKQVEVRVGGLRGGTDADCELVEQFARELLPLFTTRHVEQRFNCVPHQASTPGVPLRFESLAALPPAEKSKAP